MRSCEGGFEKDARHSCFCSLSASDVVVEHSAPASGATRCERFSSEQGLPGGSKCRPGFAGGLHCYFDLSALGRSSVRKVLQSLSEKLNARKLLWRAQTLDSHSLDPLRDFQRQVLLEEEDSAFYSI